MSAAAYRQQLSSLAVAGGSPKDQAERYRAVLESILKNSGQELVEGLKVFVEAIVNENVSLVISRQLLTDVGNHLSSLPDDVSKCVSHFTLDKVQPRVVSFEEQVDSCLPLCTAWPPIVNHCSSASSEDYLGTAENFTEPALPVSGVAPPGPIKPPALHQLIGISGHKQHGLSCVFYCHRLTRACHRVLPGHPSSITEALHHLKIILAPQRTSLSLRRRYRGAVPPVPIKPRALHQLVGICGHKLQAVQALTGLARACPAKHK
ncbi:uncharacterized protein LOC119436646 [Dermacentor silvarum]|uniref:uncharacterized protein LOC119436646 n=1 Tax=Dermacentor silvarum TaxID=543639 RepID=UPI0021012B74|nr:uncharacterized protein LOC119436646 [Dermacentor silvarum]